MKDGEWLPIAFWRNKEDHIVCCFEGKLVDPLEHWTFAAKYPVHEASYRRRERLLRRSETGCKTRIPLLLSSLSRNRFLSSLSLQSRSRFKWAAAWGAKPD